MRTGGYVTIVLLCLAACAAPEPGNPDDPVLARVHQRELHLSEMEGMFPDNASPADSAVIIEAFASRWLKTNQQSSRVGAAN